MNKTKKNITLLILVILSAVILAICNNHNSGRNNQGVNMSQENSTSLIHNSEKTSGNNKDLTEFSDVQSLDSKIKNDYSDIYNLIEDNKNSYVLQLIDGFSSADISIVKDDWLKTIFLEYNGKNITERNYIVNTEENINNFIKFSKYILDNTGYSWIYPKDYYTEDSTFYSSYTDTTVVGRTNGNWNPIITKVKYINYDKSTEQPKNEWGEVFEIILNDEFHKKYSSGDNTQKENINSPIVFRKSWSFNYDNTLVEIITADNIKAKSDKEVKQYRSQYECNIDPIIPAGDINVAYKITVILINGNIAHTDAHIYKLPTAAFSFPEEGELFNDKYYSYQYDANGTVVLCPLLYGGDYILREFCYYNDYMFLDIDGDTTGELLIYHDASSSTWIQDITAYKINDTSINIYTLTLEDVLKNG